MIELRNLSKTIDGKEVLKDISLTIGKGEIFGLLGRNGSGKQHCSGSFSRFCFRIKGRFYLIRWK